MIIDAADYELEPTPWTARAACRGIAEPDLFFPSQGASATEAVAVCAGCPVRIECLDYAIRWRIDHGIWGGETVRARRRLSRVSDQHARRLPPRHGTTSRYHNGCHCQRCVEAQMAYLQENDPCRSHG